MSRAGANSAPRLLMIGGGRTAVFFALCSVVLLRGCGPFSQRPLYNLDTAYDFQGKTIGLSVIVNGDEQEALGERQIARRTMTSVENEGYAGDASTENPQSSTGIILPPANVSSLKQRLKHSRYFDEGLVHPMIARTKSMLERRGYTVRVIAVPSGEVTLRELADHAQAQGCELLAVETVALVRSWNVRQEYRSKGTGELSTSFRWQRHIGGLVLTNMSIFDIPSGKVVWEHARRDIDTGFLAPILGEVYSDRVVRARFAAHPGQYQVWMYRQSADRALYLMFNTLERGFRPLPHGSDRPDSVAAARTYDENDPVFVRAAESDIVWLPATVVSDAGVGIEVRWAKGVWPAVTRQTRYRRVDVMPRTDRWPPIVWVRARSAFKHSPFRFVRQGPKDLVTVALAGTLGRQTYLIGRVAIASDLP